EVARLRGGSTPATTALDDAERISEGAAPAEVPAEIVSAFSLRKGSVALVGAGIGGVRAKGFSSDATSPDTDTAAAHEEARGAVPGNASSSVGEVSNGLS